MQLKATQFMLPLLQLSDNNVDAIADFVGEKIAQAPALLKGAPVVVDLEALPPHNRAVDFASVVGVLRAHGMIPIGIRGADENNRDMAAAMDLAVMPGATAQRRRPATKAATKSETPAKGPANGGNEAQPTMMVDRPVRSGQRIYARGTDLIVRATVGAGSELLADGNIHVYGALRGRAMAGVGGDKTARVFCLGLDAELVSIAGVYRVNEDLDEQWRGQAVEIQLDKQRLVFTALR